MSNISSLNPRTDNQQLNSPINSQGFDSQAAIRQVVQSALGGDTFSSETLPVIPGTNPFAVGLTEEEAITSEKLIEVGDTDKNNSLDKTEFLDLMKDFIFGFEIKSDKALKRLFKELDANNDGQLSLEEINNPLELLNKAKIKDMRDIAELALDRGDANEDGGIDDEELTPMVSNYFAKHAESAEQRSEEYSKNIIKNIFTKLDKDNNDRLDINELEELFKEMARNIDPIDGKGAFKSFEVKEDEEKTNSLEDIEFTQPQI